MVPKILSLKTTAIVGAATLILGLGCGWLVSGWFHDSQELAKQTAFEKDYQRRFGEELAAYKLKAETLEQLTLTLTTSLTTQRRYYAELRKEIDRAPLQAACNPFDDEFVRLWNAAAAKPDNARRPAARAERSTR